MTVHGIDTLRGSSAADTRQWGWPSRESHLNEPQLDHELLRMQEWPLRSYLKLRAQPASVRSARRHAKTALHEWQLETLADPVELLVSEIVTNAVRASAEVAAQQQEDSRAAQIRFWLTSDHNNVLIQVWDGGHLHPIVRRSGLDAEAGRGLLLVEALSTRWGCYPRGRPDGKIVWAAVCAGAWRRDMV
jgi:anti-sigma regulatory factor (Ser/Thr protein kinase)